MNVYVLKGVIVDACKHGDGGSALKCRLFDAISYPGFMNPTYNVIGVEFGLGLMSFTDDTGEPTTVKVQAWNLNERHQFTENNMGHLLRGSRFGIACWDPDSDPAGEDLLRTARGIAASCPGIVLAIASTAPGPEVDAREIVDRVAQEVAPGTLPDVVEGTGEMMQRVVRDCIAQRRGVYHLPLATASDVAPAGCIDNPFNTYVSRASDRLRELLTARGIPVEGDVVSIHAGTHVVRINLENSTMHAGLAACKDCKETNCPQKDVDTKICVVLESNHGRGWSSGAAGLTDTDLFILAMIMAAAGGRLPPSITRQFPSCPRRGKGRRER